MFHTYSIVSSEKLLPIVRIFKTPSSIHGASPPSCVFSGAQPANSPQPSASASASAGTANRIMIFFISYPLSFLFFIF